MVPQKEYLMLDTVWQYAQEHKWLILFIIWGMPLGIYRSRFRKIVYQTNSWTINIKPVFIKELRALFGNLFPGNLHYLKMRNFYRFYLIVYLALFAAYKIWS
jgi:peroxiredoxin Q/BCP